MKFRLLFILMIVSVLSFSQKTTAWLSMSPVSYSDIKLQNNFTNISSDEIFRAHSSINFQIGVQLKKNKSSFGFNFEAFERVALKYVNNPNPLNNYYLINCYGININRGLIFKIDQLEFNPHIGLRFALNKENIYDTTIKNNQLFFTHSLNLGADFLWSANEKLAAKYKLFKHIKLKAGFTNSLDVIVVSIKNNKYNLPFFNAFGLNFGIGYSFK